MMTRRAKGKIAIVTGAARGMGAAHARRLADEGAMVVLTDILSGDGEALAAAIGADAMFLEHDVTQAADWARVVGETESRFGPASILVNNAAIGPSWRPIEDVTEQEFRRVIDIDQLSVFLGMRAVIPGMKRAGGGSIINISSVSGLVGTANAVAYAAAKFAVRGMTKAAALELAPHGIRVNSVHPGLVSTPMVDPAAAEAALSVIPMGRPGEPDEVSALVALLASDETRYTTGAEFAVDGGFSCQ
jgi:3alpha(or 20beta)-hydroxysteroid dehydrogenase